MQISGVHQSLEMPAVEVFLKHFEQRLSVDALENGNMPDDANISVMLDC